MATCLVTGSSGFIGRHLVRMLRSSPRFDRVITTDIEPSAPGQDAADHHRWDIRLPPPADLRTLESVDTCFHLAAVAKEPGYPHREYFEVNDLGTAHVSGLCAELGVTSLHYTSTMMVFAAGEERRCETDQPDPNTAYGTSKLLGEHRAAEWGAADPTRRVWVYRPGVVFGEGEAANFTRMMRLVRGGRFVYMGRRDTVKGCISVADVVGFVDHVLAHDVDPQIVHCVYQHPTTIAEIAEAMAGAYGVAPPRIQAPYLLARTAAWGFAALDRLGVENSIHPRRIEKLHDSTDITTDTMTRLGYAFRYPTVADALDAWLATGDPALR